MFSRALWHPSLRLRILAPAALVAIPAIALLLYISFDRLEQAERAVIQNAERLAALKSLDHERFIEDTRRLLTAVSESRDVREGDSAACSAYLRRLVLQFGAMYANLAVIDAKGMLTCSGLTAASGSLADRSYFQRALASKSFVVGEYIVGRQTRKASLPFALPILNEAGVVQQVVVAAVDLPLFGRGLASDDALNEATVIVTDREHTIVGMYPNAEKWIGQSLKADPVTAQIGARETGTVEHNEGGDVAVFAFSRVQPLDSGITVRVFLSKTQARAAATRTMYRSLLTFGLVACIIIAAVQVASHRLLLRPIAQLTSASRRLAAGDLGARVAASTTIPELHELGRGFDEMAAALEARERERVLGEIERKQLEQRFYQAQKMDAVGRLAGGIAHDFNNMLTAILGYCELLLDDPAISDSQRGDVLEIQKAGKTAAQLTRQLLAVSRREVVEPSVLDMNAIVSAMDRMLHRLVGEHIDMAATLAPDLHLVKADRGQIEQVILNLTVNARDAMPDGGCISIETANVHLPEGVVSTHLSAPAGDYVMLTVKDTGSGITPDVVEHLFEPFFTTKDRGKGTGLGLATVYGIVKQGNGGILVETTIGKGTTFRIYFRQSDERVAAVAQTAAPVVEPSRNGNATILVVEDDAGIRELSTKILSRSGYTVLVAASGEEARQICQHHDGIIHVLLSDVVMPGMNGPMVAETLTRMRPSLKVVFMSGYTDDIIVRHGGVQNDVPFLQKPFSPERLANTILEVLG
jgi:signal transduction histidine kinase/CheY-like chemotaxis protein